MGCSASSKQATAEDPKPQEGVLLRSVIVWGAKDLRNADIVGDSDPYCIARVGPKGSTWNEKVRGTGRRSQTVTGSTDPEWRLGFSVDVAGMDNPELQVRVYDADWSTWDDFLGEAVAVLSELGAERAALALSGSRAKGSIAVSAGCSDLFTSQNVAPSGFYEQTAPMGQKKSVQVEDITADGPLLLGTAPLPENLQGLFWLTQQASGSAVASFGGPSRDGGGCSTGQLASDGRYDVRVAGDRVWSLADDGTTISKFIEAADLVYHFIFDDSANPKKAQIYPEARNLGFTLTAEWLLDFEMELVEGGDERWQGSVVWRRPSEILGKKAEYALVQIMTGDGTRIEPAWSEFVKYQNSAEAGPDPGKIFYREISSSG